jgi:hypothetical protein
MMDIKEFYILGLPIQTEIGECQFLKVKEYPDYFMDLQVASMSKDQIIHKYCEINKNGALNELIDELRRLPLYEIVHGIPELQNSYYKLFNKVFNSEYALSHIDEKSFDYYRKLVITMNCMKEERINPNPEIQKAIERSKRVKSLDGEKTEFADIVTSVVGFNGLSYQDINEFTIYQLYMTYYRIAQFKNYDTTTLFSTVSTEKIKIDSWSKHIDLFEEEKHFVTSEEFNKNTSSMFKE